MAFDVTNLHLRAGAPGDLTYTYDAGSDTMATVNTAGYFNNTDDNVNLIAEDRIWCQCSDGNMWLRVTSVAAAGAVTTQFAGGNLPIQTFATGTEAALVTLEVGYYEAGTVVATATRAVLPTPYPGAEVIVRKVGSGTQSQTFDAGGSGATSIVYDAEGNRRITLRLEGEGFHVVGSSTTRWRINALHLTATGKDGSYAGEGASNSIGATT